MIAHETAAHGRRGRIAGALALATAFAWGTVGALHAAGPAVMEQRDITFVPNKISIRAGESVTLVNADVFGHNVYSDSEGGRFDIGLQESGTAVPVTFEEPGTFRLYCRIHPKMRAIVDVLP